MIVFLKLIFVFHFINLICCFAGDPTSVGESDVEIDLPNLGRIRGKIEKSFFTGRPIYHFLGINYAEPPSKERRFKPPQAFAPWNNNTYNATKMRQNCPQTSTAYYPPLDPEQLDEKEDVEDCLVVNVFTPELNETKPLLPVMFYIHGGSFYSGSAYDFFPDFLLEEHVLLVVVQYRLGVLGFLSLNTDEIPGNLGMLDIILALEWVQSNIKHFGGDPNLVTVVGQSAGAAATSSLLVSPLVKEGLFHKAIIQSGTSLNTWAVENDPVTSAKIIAKHLNCKKEDISEIVKCFQDANVTDLVAAHAKYVNENTVRTGTSLIVQTAGERKFLVEHPRKSFEKGQFLKMPVMGGTTREEGTFIAAAFYLGKGLQNLSDSDYYERNITRDVLLHCGYNQDNIELMTDYMHSIYFKNKNISSFNEMAAGLTDMFGVLLLKGSTYETLRLLSSRMPTFAYSFNFYGNVSKLRNSDSMWANNIPLPGGVAHSDELGYLFPSFRVNYTERELKMVKKMTKYWTNFMKIGVPDGKWQPLAKPFGPYLRISDNSKMRQNFLDEFTVTSTEGFLSGSAQSSRQTPVSVFLLLVTYGFKLMFL